MFPHLLNHKALNKSERFVRGIDQSHILSRSQSNVSINSKLRRYLTLGFTVLGIITVSSSESQSAEFSEPLVDKNLNSKSQQILSEEVNTVIKEVQDWLLIADGQFDEVNERYLSKSAYEAVSLAHKFDFDDLDDQYIIGEIFVDYYSKIDPFERRYFDHVILSILTNLHNHKKYKYAIDLAFDYLTKNTEWLDPMACLYTQKIMIFDTYQYIKSQKSISYDKDPDLFVYVLYYVYLRVMYNNLLLEWHIDEEIIPDCVKEKFKITIPSDLFQ